MAIASDIMKGGVPAFLARAIGGQVQSAVSAAGTAISDATDLTASINVVTTAAASSGVQLPNVQVGDSVEILNLGANAVTVYPDTTSNQINALSAGSGFLLATNTAVVLRKFTSTRWAGFLSA
jgi:hypothetical protein